jgi:UDP-N-acetylmuramoylalanine--D-glutamate ligase
MVAGGDSNRIADTLLFPDMNRDFRDARVTIMGLGRFGGGVGVTRWLAGQGAAVTVTDRDRADDLEASLGEIGDLVDDGRVTLQLGGHDRRVFMGCDVVIVNPAVPRPWDNDMLRVARDAGAEVTTEIGLAVQRLDRERVIGVTGTAGKSTTAAMIHHTLTAAGARSHLGGNLGGTLLSSLEDIERGDLIVLELSSAMLHWLGELEWSPRVAVVTNLAENHVDWHGTFEAYAAAKRQIWASQRPGRDYLVCGDASTAAWAADAPSALTVVTDHDPPSDDVELPVPGAHNRRNARVAVAASSVAADADAPRLAATLTSFRGLPHRLQLVVERDGCRFYDDSKSTTPAATELAVAAFGDPTQVHLIAGGYDKNIDLSPVAELSTRLAGLYTIGVTGPGLAAMSTGENVHSCQTLETAVATALSRMRPGDTLLLSPACASWDQFTNYEERGRAFASALS